MANNTVKEWAVYTFCRTKKHPYISKKLDFPDFKAGKAELLKFHKLDLPSPAKRTAIDRFAADLSDFLWALDFKETEGARPKVRDAIRRKTSPIQELLDVVAANYK